MYTMCKGIVVTKEEKLKSIESIESGEKCVCYSEHYGEIHVPNIAILDVCMLEESRPGFFRMYIAGKKTVIGNYADIYRPSEKNEAFDRAIKKYKAKIEYLESILKNLKQRCAELEEKKE